MAPLLLKREYFLEYLSLRQNPAQTWAEGGGYGGDPPLAFQNQTPPGRVSGPKYPPSGALLSKLAVTARFSAASGGHLEGT